MWRLCDAQLGGASGMEFALTTHRSQATQFNNEDQRVMRIYDIEFDIDSFLDEMEEQQKARRQRQQQIHRSDIGASVSEGPSERDAD